MDCLFILKNFKEFVLILCWQNQRFDSKQNCISVKNLYSAVHPDKKTPQFSILMIGVRVLTAEDQQK